MKQVMCAVAMLVASTSPVLAAKFFAVTPSGSAEMLFPDEPSVTISTIVSKCIDSHWTVVSSSTTEVVCEAPLTFGQSLLGTLALGNQYSTPPRRFFKFNATEVSGISRVQASGWMELQMAFGQTRRTDFAGPEFQNSILFFLHAAGGRYPVGTTFPNHVTLGVGFAEVPLQKAIGLRVTSIEPGSPASKASMEVNDVVSSIAGKHFKNMDTVLEAEALAAASPTYDVEITRNGQKMKLSLDRAFRPPVTEVVVARHQSVSSTSDSGKQSSDVADELAKLAALRDKGILSTEEFNLQKKKLLDSN